MRMRHCYLLTGLVLAGFTLAGCLGSSRPAAPLALKTSALAKRVAVVGLDNKTPVDQAGLENLATAALIKGLSSSRRLKLIDPARVERAVDELGLPAQALTPGMAVLIGRRLRANVVITGAVTELGLDQQRIGWRAYVPLVRGVEVVEAEVVAYALDVESGVMIEAEPSTGARRNTMDGLSGALGLDAAKQSLAEAAAGLGRRLAEAVEKAAWKAFVLEVKGHEVLINAGQDVGMGRGQRFAAYEDAERITSYDGRVYVVPGKVKALLEATNVMSTSARLRLTSGSVNQGDSVQALN